ncbi:type III polyketide synthase [Streptomyces sp. NPDC058108]|uniref:type III polyketide synthase n=1 Tax=Streptomyces sp. NPDC058108 TaxID=3346344 RepID=UPI0036E66B0E
MPQISVVEGLQPPHRYTQDEITEKVVAFISRFPSDGTRGTSPGVARRMSANAGVRQRAFAVPLDQCLSDIPFAEASRTQRRAATRMGAETLTAALARAGVRPEDVDALVSTSYTAIGTPLWDLEVLRRAGLRPDVRRVPMNGLGCVGGVALIARMHEYLKGNPGQIAVGLAVEPAFVLAGQGGPTLTRLAEWALFGDGSAAVVMAGDERTSELPPGPHVVDTHSVLVPGSERMAGWYLDGDRLRTLLDPGLPGMVMESVRTPVETLLNRHGLKPEDVGTWTCHAGSRKMLDTMAEGLGVEERALRHAYEVLAHCGNMASVTVLHALRGTLADPPVPGGWGVVLAVGPGLVYEAVLLRWPETAVRSGAA